MSRCAVNLTATSVGTVRLTMPPEAAPTRNALPLRARAFWLSRMLNWLRTHPLRRMLPLVFLLAVTGFIGAGAYWLAVHMEKRGRTALPAFTAPTAAQIAIDARQADEMVQRIVALERAAEAVVVVDPAAALEKMREALRLQHELNVGQIDSRHKSVVREARLSQRVEALAIEPLRLAAAKALAEARAAVAARRWDNARLAYNRARMLQEQLNREHTGSSYADAQALNLIDEEISTLDAADRAAATIEGERLGDVAAAEGRWLAASEAYARAQTQQREINEKFPRSHLASAPRLDALEVKRQTALSAQDAALVGQLEREASGRLRRRQVPAAQEKIAAATAVLEHLATAFPLSRRLDPVVRLKLEYLQSHRADLVALQNQVYAQLRPVPGRLETLLLQTEVPQSLYAQVMNTNPSRHAGPTLPVDSVSWLDAQDFCQRLGWVLGTAVRLPTEEEWRATLAAGEQAAWSAETSGGGSREVGLSPANANGFHDLLGNVAEWLQPQTSGPAQTAQVAGGSFLDAAEALRARPITLFGRGEHLRHVGFRVVVERPAETVP
jgi:hypothetical protein